jgi:hypothetical protein
MIPTEIGVTMRQQKQCRGAMDTASEILDEIERRLIGPVNILNHQDGGQRATRKLVQHCREERRTIRIASSAARNGVCACWTMS